MAWSFMGWGGVGGVLETEYKMSTSSFSKPWGRGLLLSAQLFLELSSISQMSPLKLRSQRWGGNWEAGFQCKVYQITFDHAHHLRAPRAPGLLLAESGNWHHFHCANFFFFT